MMFYRLAFIVLWSTPGYTTPPSSSKAQSRDEIDHAHIVYNKITNLHLSNRFSDVVLHVRNEEFHAHRILLALRSGYFRDLFYGDDKTDDSEVNISAEPVKLFKILLQYFYTAQIPSGILKGPEIFEFFDMTDTLKVSHLQSERPKTNMDFNDLINHSELLMSDIKSLYLSESFSDVVFVFGEERLHAHRFLLASQSEIFRVLLYDGLKETKEKNVVINEEPITSFKRLLRYIYSGQLDLSDLEDGDICELYKIADFYNVINLKHKLYKYLRKSINLHNVWSFLNTTRFYQLNELEVQSLYFIDINAWAVLENEDFLNLSPGALEEILNRDTFYAKELDIFHAVCRWIKKNKKKLNRDTKIKVLSAVRYSLMSDEELTEARELRLESSDIISDAIQLRNSLTQDKPQFRGQLKPNVNLVYEQRQLNDFTDTGINMYELEEPSKINFIEISLWYVKDKQNEMGILNLLRCYSYYVEVSINGIDWVRVIDHSNYNCRMFQKLWIHPQIVRCIRFVGTANETFKPWNIRYDSEDIPMIDNNNGLFVPKRNVASELNRAIVIKGENSVNDKSLLNEYWDDDSSDDDSGGDDSRHDIYTYHLVNSGYIVIHLTQPFILSSMRMLLWGGDNHTYRYTIEVSVDDEHWKTVVDKSNENTRSWQLLNFIPTPTLYIRIIGVFSSADNEFRSVYFEAPAQEPIESNVVQDDISTTDTESSETDITMAENSSENPDD